MTRYFVHLSYAGEAYRGYQVQAEGKTVQGILELAFSALLKQKVTLWGCGRTDAGVHASQYFIHFETADELPDGFVYKLNKILPADISLYSIEKVDHSKHARYHAFLRRYHYFLHTEKSSVLAHKSALYDREKLDFQKMAEAISLIGNYRDFRGFCKTPNRYPNAECKIYSVQAYKNQDGTQFCFEISANRFLRGMIRNIMAKVILVGAGKMSLHEFESYLLIPDPRILPIPAKPEGLYLSEVRYPFIEAVPKINPLNFLLIQHGDSWSKLLP